MQADRRFIEHKHSERTARVPSRWQLQPLCLAADNAGVGSPKRQIPQTEPVQRGQLRAHGAQRIQQWRRVVDVHRQELRQRARDAIRAFQTDAIGRIRITRPPTVGTFDIDVGKKLNIQRDRTGAIAGGATQSARIVRERAGLRPRSRAPSVFANARRRSSWMPQYVATVERIFEPIGVASINSTFETLSASIERPKRATRLRRWTNATRGPVSPIPSSSFRNPTRR